MYMYKWKTLQNTKSFQFEKYNKILLAKKQMIIISIGSKHANKKFD